MGAWQEVHARLREINERLEALEAKELRIQVVEAALHQPEPRMRFRTPDRDKLIVPWFAVEDVRPPERLFVMVTGPTDYGDRQFLCLAQIDGDFRPNLCGPLRWLDEGNDALTDRGYVPTHWAHRILLPGDLR